MSDDPHTQQSPFHGYSYGESQPHQQPTYRDAVPQHQQNQQQSFFLNNNNSTAQSSWSELERLQRDKSLEVETIQQLQKQLTDRVFQHLHLSVFCFLILRAMSTAAHVTCRIDPMTEPCCDTPINCSLTNKIKDFNENSLTPTDT